MKKSALARAARRIRAHLATVSPYDSMPLPVAVRAAIGNIDSHIETMFRTVEQVRVEMKKQEDTLRTAMASAFELLGTSKAAGAAESLRQEGYDVFEMDDELRQDMKRAMELIQLMKKEGLMERSKDHGATQRG